MLRRCYIFVLFSFFCVGLYAQNKIDTIKLAQIQISAEKLFDKNFAGMKSDIVDTIILQQKNNVSLSDVLSENTSIFIKNYGRGALSTASFRGTAASHTQVNWNGININSPMAGMVDFSLIPVFLIDEMKLNFGGSSIADNNGGFGGSINISNSANWKQKFNSKFMQSIGSYNTFNEFFQLDIGGNRIKSKTRVYFNYSKNDFTFINHGIVNYDTLSGEFINPLDTNKNAGYKIYGILQEFYFKPNNSNFFSLKWWQQNAYRTIPRATSYEGPDNSNRNSQADFDNKFVFDWKHYSNNSKFVFLSGISLKNLLYELKNNIIGVGFVPVIYSNSFQKSFFNKMSFSYDFNDKFSFETGINFDFHDVQTTDTVNKIGYLQYRTEFSGFVCLKKNFWNKLNVNFLVHQLVYDKKFAPITPFGGVDFKPFSNINLIFKANISRNFHLPSLNDLYWQPGGNPDLLPETGISYEIGLEFLKYHNYFEFFSEITAYKSNINNWIIWLPSYKGYWEPLNINRVLSQGVEFSVNFSGKFHKVLYKFSGTYSYTESKNYGDVNIWGQEAYGKQLVYVPLHSGNFMAYFTFHNFNITYQHNYYSQRFTTSSNDISKRDWLYPYFMNDLSFGKLLNFNKLKINFSFNIYNLFNETYHSILYRPMPKRNFLFTVSVNLLSNKNEN